MNIDKDKLDLILARQCLNVSDLRIAVSPQTLRRVRAGKAIKPGTAGRIARILNVDVSELVCKEVSSK